MEDSNSNSYWKHCEKCNELTPHIDNNTVGMSCQICFNTTPCGIDSAAATMTYKELAAFWQNKYYLKAGVSVGGYTVTSNSIILSYNPK